MMDHLNLAIDMYLDDDIRKLKDEKEVSIDLNFDENNASSSHVRLVTVHHCGQNTDSNADGLKKLKATRVTCSSFILGTLVLNLWLQSRSRHDCTWPFCKLPVGNNRHLDTRPIPVLYVFCGDYDPYSAINQNGIK